jgi:hypothetical protein
MAKKDIRVTFFYADETIWALAKKFKTTVRMVKWANEFFDRYDFQIDEYPVPFNESTYKKKFSLAKTKGLKADLGDYYRIDAEINASLKKINELSGDDLTTELDKFYKLLKEREAPVEFELLLRKKIHTITNSLSIQKDRLPVFICEFKNQKATYGITRKVSLTFGFGFWTLKNPSPVILNSGEIYTRPIILIDINEVTKSHEQVLVHEAIHAAGGVHPTAGDDKSQGPNIMSKDDVWNKGPTEVNLYTDDATRLGVATFVI